MMKPFSTYTRDNLAEVLRALMLLLFAGGVMNLTVIGSLTLFVILEKTGALGRHGARISGAVLVASGLWMLRH